MLKLYNPSGVFVTMIPDTDYTDLKIVSTLKDGDKELSFVYFGKPSLIQNECYIRTDEDEFVVKEIHPGDHQQRQLPRDPFEVLLLGQAPQYPEEIPVMIADPMRNSNGIETNAARVTRATRRAWERDETGTAEGILVNDSYTVYGLDAGERIPIELNGQKAPTIPAAWLREYARGALKFEAWSRTARRRSSDERKDKAEYIREHIAGREH